MSTMTNDKPEVETGSIAVKGLLLALLSAATFGMSGGLARGLLDTGWTPGAVVLARIGLAALVVAPFGIRAMAGRWQHLRPNLVALLSYGVLAVAGAQFCYFSAVGHMQVGPALLIEYTAPAAIVVWMWLRHGEKPTRLTLIGAGLAALGLVLVLDLISGAELSVPGVLWSLGAMVGCATYFVMSADDSSGLPPIALASGGLLVGGAALAVLGLVGVLPMRAATASVLLAGHQTSWWVPILLLGIVTAAVAYVAGIAATRILGARLASFVALVEVIAGVVWAWVLLDELPRTVQLLGGVLILAGVITVKLGEPAVASERPAA